MNGFERRKEQKKKNIIEASLALFKEFGIQKVSIAEIAQKANVSQVTIYNYFESKDNLVQLVFKYYVDLVWEEQKALFNLDLPFKEKIERMMFEKNDLTDEMGEKFFQDFMIDYSSGKSYVEELYLKEGLPRLIELFNEGKKQGYIDPNISNEAMLLYLQMFKDFMQRKDIAQTLLPVTQELTKLFFYGIVGERK
ncbi:TetR/AcrR family transcriptional regulator [Alkalihalobacillus sp. 1P02AB]|uniref:TetR/AcrR family transcriptional regulator n=1 Tax=Alkalihalobacillus sp. 1P02AB TaxID=3132260 RepID=UPI0039A51F71